MFAIVLTYDERIEFTKLVLFHYKKFWNNKNIIYRIPYNNKLPNISFPNIQLKKTSKDIRSTIYSLINDIDDDEFVYWCFDDVYPVHAITPQIWNNIYNFINNKDNSKLLENIHAIRLIRLPAEYQSKLVNKFGINNVMFGKKTPFCIDGIWFHQFIKTRILKLFFLNDKIISKHKLRDIYNISKNLNHNIYLPIANQCIFAETTRGPYITLNCIEDMQKLSLIIPNMKCSGSRIFNNGHIQKF